MGIHRQARRNQTQSRVRGFRARTTNNRYPTAGWREFRRQMRLAWSSLKTKKIKTGNVFVVPKVHGYRGPIKASVRGYYR